MNQFNENKEREQWEHWLSLTMREVHGRLRSFANPKHGMGSWPVVQDAVSEAVALLWKWHCRKRQAGEVGIGGCQLLVNSIVSCARRLILDLREKRSTWATTKSGERIRVDREVTYQELDSMDPFSNDKLAWRIAYYVEELRHEMWLRSSSYAAFQKEVAEAVASAPQFVQRVADALMYEPTLGPFVCGIKTETGMKKTAVYEKIQDAKADLKVRLAEWEPKPQLPSNWTLTTLTATTVAHIESWRHALTATASTIAQILITTDDPDKDIAKANPQATRPQLRALAWKLLPEWCRPKPPSKKGSNGGPPRWLK